MNKILRYAQDDTAILRVGGQVSAYGRRSGPNCVNDLRKLGTGAAQHLWLFAGTTRTNGMLCAQELVRRLAAFPS